MFSILKTTSFTSYADDIQMKLNTDKCHVLLNSHGTNTIKIGNLCTNNFTCKKLLSINNNYKLIFTNHIEEICKKTSRKLSVLARLAPYMGISKKRTLLYAFFKSQFNYCLLIWMCCNRSWNNKIDWLHERCLRLVCNDNTSNFSELLGKDGSASIHYQDI